MLRLLVQIGEVGPKFAGKDQNIEADRGVLLQIFSVHTPPLADGAVLFWQLQIWDVVIAAQNVFILHKISLLYFGVETILQEAVIICECADYSVATSTFLPLKATPNLKTLFTLLTVIPV